MARADAGAAANIVNLAGAAAVDEVQICAHRIVDMQEISGDVVPELKRPCFTTLNSPHPRDERGNQELLGLTPARVVEASRADDANAGAHRELKRRDLLRRLR